MVKKICRKILVWLSRIIILISSLSALWLGYQRIQGKPLPTLFGWSVANVLTGSMEPNIPAGSLILVKANQEYSSGDVVAYKHAEGMTVVHRIVAIDDNTAITKGDNNNIADAPIAVSNILGKVEKIIPGAGKVVQVLKQPEVIIFLVAIIAIICFLPLPEAQKKGGSSV